VVDVGDDAEVSNLLRGRRRRLQGVRGARRHT
jgi:hypothetical protein